MIYFAQANKDGAIKIGYSEEPNARVYNLQTNLGIKLRILATMAGTLEDESDLHARFDAHRVHGEWYFPVPELLELIKHKAVPWPEDDVPNRTRSTTRQISISCTPEYREWVDGLLEWYGSRQTFIVDTYRVLFMLGLRELAAQSKYPTPMPKAYCDSTAGRATKVGTTCHRPKRRLKT